MKTGMRGYFLSTTVLRCKKVSSGEGGGVSSFRHGCKAFFMGGLYLEKTLVCAIFWPGKSTRYTKRDLY